VPSHMPSVDRLSSRDSLTPSRRPIGIMVFFYVATTSAAMFHALICTAASNFTTAQGGRRPRYWEIYHRGEALRLINVALSDPVEATSDATIAAIIYVSGFEVSPKT
jgi:Fungal specific transcription factor domain